MPVEVRLPTILRSHAGGVPSVTVEGSTVGELFDGLVAKYPGLKGQLVTESGDRGRASGPDHRGYAWWA